MKVLIIVPCYNERDNIVSLHKEICHKTQYDVLFINDCSTDDSEEILCREGIPHLSLPINLGIGGAVQTGYRVAFKKGYDICLQLDGDGQHNPVYVDRILSPIIEKNADLVIGSRFLNRTGFQSSVMRRTGISFFKILIFCLTGVKITDATSGFRALNRKVLRLFIDFYAKDYPEPESNTLALRNKLRITEIPVNMRQRQGGKSSISTTRSIYYMFKVTLGIFISLIKPKHNFTD